VRITWTAILASGFWLGTTLSTSAQVHLTPQWKPGETVRYLIEDDSTSRSDQGAQFFELEQRIILHTRWEVQPRTEAGNPVLRGSVERVQFRAQGKGAAAIVKDLQFDSGTPMDSTSPQAKAVAKVLQQYIGPEFTVTLAENGQVKDFEFSEPWTKLLTETTTRELAGFYSKLFSPAYLRERLTAFLIAFPADPIREGGTWTETISGRLGGSLVEKRIYTLTEANKCVENAPLKIKSQSQWSVIPEENRDVPPVQIVEQSAEGEILYNPQAHRIVAAEFKERLVLQDFGKSTMQSHLKVKGIDRPQG
jgi:hypothetical protein